MFFFNIFFCLYFCFTAVILVEHLRTHVLDIYKAVPHWCICLCDAEWQNIIGLLNWVRDKVLTWCVLMTMCPQPFMIPSGLFNRLYFSTGGKRKKSREGEKKAHTFGLCAKGSLSCNVTRGCWFVYLFVVVVSSRVAISGMLDFWKTVCEIFSPSKSF